MQLPSDVTYRLLRYDPAAEPSWRALLSPEEQAQLEGFRLAKRRREFTLGRVAARTLLAERLGVAPGEVPLRVAEGGALEVAGCPQAVSIAHAGGQAVAAVAARRVGVDLERIRPRHPELPRFLLHADEYAPFERLPLDRARATILYWTLKEAMLKGLGTGFRLSPKKLRLCVDLEGGRAEAEVEGGTPWQLRFEERGGFYLAVAYDPR